MFSVNIIFCIHLTVKFGMTHNIKLKNINWKNKLFKHLGILEKKTHENRWIKEYCCRLYLTETEELFVKAFYHRRLIIKSLLINNLLICKELMYNFNDNFSKNFKIMSQPISFLIYYKMLDSFLWICINQPFHFPILWQ